MPAEVEIDGWLLLVRIVPFFIDQNCLAGQHSSRMITCHTLYAGTSLKCDSEYIMCCQPRSFLLFNLQPACFPYQCFCIEAQVDRHEM